LNAKRNRRKERSRGEGKMVGTCIRKGTQQRNLGVGGLRFVRRKGKGVELGETERAHQSETGLAED